MQFKQGKDSIQNDLISGRSLKARTVEIINKVKNFMLTYRRVKSSGLTNEMEI